LALIAIAALARVRNRQTGDPLTDTHVVQLAGVSRQARLDVAQTFPGTELRESHHTKMLDARPGSHSAVGLATIRDALNPLPWREVHDLSKQRLFGVCRGLPVRKADSLSKPVFRRSNRGHRRTSAPHCSDRLFPVFRCNQSDGGGDVWLRVPHLKEKDPPGADGSAQAMAGARQEPGCIAEAA
jgi:hypothetical protein